MTKGAADRPGASRAPRAGAGHSAKPAAKVPAGTTARPGSGADVGSGVQGEGVGTPGPSAKPDLRAQRRLRNRLAVQQVALALFAEQGYEATTVEAIAAESGISPATFYRYFPTKEDVVIFDSLDDVLSARVLAQPADVPVAAAFQRSMREVWAGLNPAEKDRERTRARLSMTVPQIRARQIESFAQGIDMVAKVLARRTGRPDGDPDCRIVAGAVTGAVLTGLLSGDHFDADYLPAIADSLDRLAFLLPIEATLRGQAPTGEQTQARGQGELG